MNNTEYTVLERLLKILLQGMGQEGDRSRPHALQSINKKNLLTLSYYLLKVINHITMIVLRIVIITASADMTNAHRPLGLLHNGRV